MKDIEIKYNKNFIDIIRTSKRFIWLSGGRGSGKTTHIVTYFVLKLFKLIESTKDDDRYFKGVVSRYTSSSIKNSLYSEIYKQAGLFGLEKLLYEKDGNIYVNIIGNDNSIITHSFQKSSNTKTAKNKGLSDVTHLIIDEAQEIPTEKEYDDLILTFRNINAECKILVALNFDNQEQWQFKSYYKLFDTTNNELFKQWYSENKEVKFRRELFEIEPQINKWGDNHIFIHTYYKDNNHLPESFLKSIDIMKKHNYSKYRFEMLGIPREGFEGVVYTDWLFDDEVPTEALENISYGLDFGFTHPTALVKINWCVMEHKVHIWLKEIVYKSNMQIVDDSGSSLLDYIKQEDISSNVIIMADSENNMAISQLRQNGVRIMGYNKKAKSVLKGIMDIKNCIVHLHPDSSNLKTEYLKYCWDSKLQDKPKKEFDDGLDAFRYATNPIKFDYLVSSNL